MRNVLITGGARGIGAAMVRRFAAAGDRVLFTYRRSEIEAKALCEETSAEAICADVTNTEEIKNAVRNAINRYSGIDVLINNAGIGLNRMLIDTTDKEYRRVMDTNVFGVFCTMRAVLPYMIERRTGTIVNISSIWGQTGGACEAIYSASKTAVIGLTLATAKEVAEAGIRINCIAPGLIDTDMNEGIPSSEMKALLNEIPMRRMGTPQEIAETAFFFASEEAAYITGQVISVNGGWLM